MMRTQKMISGTESAKETDFCKIYEKENDKRFAWDEASGEGVS